VWYHRLIGFAKDEDRGVYPEDFDEGLSDVDEKEEEKEPPAKLDCDCDSSADDCECEVPNDAEDALTERSYNGSDVEYYYGLKEDREDRKWELRDRKETERKEKERYRKIETIKVKEGHTAFESMQ
jgi:hypothetical protein